jgi:hypothetical protein
MRITRDTLLQIARDTAAERIRVNRRIICIYLTGSLRSEDPLIGGTADIDLMIIHDSQPAVEREVVRLSDEIHLDIAHLPQDLFRQPRGLRTNPWFSPFIVSHPLVYHDTQHWFEFAQASITSQFNLPANVIQRAHALSSLARRSWREMSASPLGGPAQVWKFLKAAENAANSIATLSGPPLTERRFLVEFPTRALVMGKPELSSRLLDLVVPQFVEKDTTFAPWKDALDAAAALPDCPAHLQSPRCAYYLRSALALQERTPAASTWILLRTFSQAAALLPEASPQVSGWASTLQTLGYSPQTFPDRLAALDSYLDLVEETLDEWSRSNGV